MKIYDIRLTIDGLLLRDDENIDDVVKKIEGVIETSYPVRVDVDYVEEIE